MLGDHAVVAGHIEQEKREQQVLRQAAKALLTCIPPCRPIDIVTNCIIRDELANPSIDYLAVAQVSPNPSVSVDTIDVNELIVLLNGVAIPELPNLDVHDKTSLSARIASKLKGNQNSGNASANLGVSPKREPHYSMSSAVCSDEESVKSCVSVQSAAGHIPGLTRQPVLRSAKKERKGSRLRVDRQSIGGGKVGAAIDSVLNQQELSAEQVLTLKEAIDSGNMLEHIQPAFTLIGLWSDLFADRPDSVELVLTFCLTALSVFLETKTCAILPFDVNHFLLRVLPIVTEMTCIFELKHSVVSLSCIFSCDVVDDSVMSAYFMSCLDVIKSPVKTRKPVLPQLRNMLTINFSHQSDLMKERSLIDLMELFSSSYVSENVRLVVELSMECLMTLGGKDKLALLNSLCKLLSDYLWHRVIDQKCVGDKREYIHACMSEVASLMVNVNCYPVFSISQVMVPLCIKSLGKESNMDALIKCRLIDFVGKAVLALNSTTIDNFTSEKPASWLELFEAWSEGKSAYSQVVKDSVLYRNKDKMLAFLSSLCGADSVTIRLKAIRAVVAAGKLCHDVVMDCLESKLSDPSPAARECILDAFLKDFSSSVLSDAIIKQDSSGSVQKKSLKLLSTQLSFNPQLMPHIISSILTRTATADSMTDLCYAVLRDDWFIKTLESPELLIVTIMNVSGLLSDQQTLKWFIDRLLADFTIEPHHSKIVDFLNKSVDKMIDKILDVGAEDSNNQMTHTLLAAIGIFSQSTPKLLEPHLEILKHFATSSNHRTVEAALSLLAQCSTHVSLSALKGSKGFTELLTKAILTGTENTVRFAIDCLYVYCSRVEGNYELILRLWSKFSKYLRTQLDEPSGSAASYSRALFSLGCLCRHSGRAEADSSNIPGHLRSAVQVFVKWFHHEDCELSVRSYALQSVVQAIESFPSLLIDPIIVDLIDDLKQPNHLATVLKCIMECLVITNQHVNTNISFDPNAANRQSVNPLTASIIQKYLTFIFDSIINDDHHCQMAGIRLLFKLLLLGNTNPFTLVPYIVAFTSSPSEAVRMEAEQALGYLIDKHPSFINAQLSKTIQICYRLCDQQMWTTNVDNDNEESTVLGPLSMFYEKCAELKRKSSDTLSHITKLICESKDLHFLSWIVQSASLLRLRQPGEVSCLIKGVAQESALIADSIIEEGAVDAIEIHQLVKFIILSCFHNHLKRVYSGLREDTANSKTVIKQRPKLLSIPSEWLTVNQEQAYDECMRIIQEDTIRVSLEDLEDSDELSMKSPPLITTTLSQKGKSKKHQFKVSKPKAVKKHLVVVPLIDSPGSQRKSNRAVQSRVNYFESSDEDEVLVLADEDDKE